MTDEQFRVLREQKLELVKTILTGDLHVRDADGLDYLLNGAGGLEPFDLQRGVRASPSELPG